MKSYMDITLLPDAEIPLSFLWEKVYQQVHLAFADNAGAEGKVKVGVAFPEYYEKPEGHPLGDKLRLVASSAEELASLNIPKWLSRLSGYAVFTGIRNVPDRVKYAHFKRLRPKGNNERLARRKAKREGISYDDALACFAGRQVKLNNAPYVRMKSLSNTNRFRLMIDCVGTEETRMKGFDSYGLSAKSSVPIF